MAKHFKDPCKSFAQFARNYLECTPTPMQEAFMDYLAAESKPNVSVVKTYSIEKERINNEFACSKLTELQEGEWFCLATPLGLYKFKLEAFIPFVEDAGINPTEVIIDDGGE